MAKSDCALYSIHLRVSAHFYSGLDHLETHIIPEIITLNPSEIEDIYPCPPMIDGILLSQLKGFGSYEIT